MNGHWINVNGDDSELRCSVCNFPLSGTKYIDRYLIVPYNYCPNCGSDMRGKKAHSIPRKINTMLVASLVGAFVELSVYALGVYCGRGDDALGCLFAGVLAIGMAVVSEILGAKQ